jgi:hypothetical protein
MIFFHMNTSPMFPSSPSTPASSSTVMNPLLS